jgi:hypothetical protein
MRRKYFLFITVGLLFAVFYFTSLVYINKDYTLTSLSSNVRVSSIQQEVSESSSTDAGEGGSCQNQDADINGDGLVNVQDLLLVIINWNTDDPDSDINNDGVVDNQDFNLVISNWGECSSVCVDNCGFAYGLDYARRAGVEGIEDYGELFSETGANWIKQTIMQWRIIQPTANSAYQWDIPDSLIEQYQERGFDVLVVLSSDAPWAIQPAFCGTPLITSCPPRPGRWDDFAAYVSAVVERYDGDGFNDKPNLIKPVTKYEVLSEAQIQLYWRVPFGQDRLALYGQLLQTAYEAALEANPNVTIILSGINLGDIFDDGENRTHEEMVALVNNRFADDAVARNFWLDILEFVRGSLAFGDYYDEVEFHYNQHYRGAYGTTNYIKSELENLGYSKPIMAGDALISSTQIHVSPLSINPQYPLMGTLIFDAMDNADHQHNQEAWQWHLRTQSYNLAKKIIIAFDNDLIGLMAANQIDWFGWSDYWKYAGFYGVDNPAQQQIVQGKRPAFYNYGLVINKIGLSPSSVSRIDVGINGVYLYKITKPDNSVVFVGWYEDPTAEDLLHQTDNLENFFSINDNRETTTIDLSEYFENDSVSVTHAYSEIDQTEPIVEVRTVSEVEISEKPVFIE